ncbi:MAG: HNH endonuclease signature motif containing protein [Chloroflexota bacterium]
MSFTYISVVLRRLVIARALQRCEYCLIHEDDTHAGCQVDHIISEKNSGKTTASNLAYSCTHCNRYKGSDVGSIAETGDFVRFFNPRKDTWSEHFYLDDSTIVPITDIGEVTARILRFNDIKRVMERQDLIEFGLYP